MTKEEIIDVIHKTIYQFFDVCGDNEEVPMSDKDELLLSVNKAICNNIKALEQPCEDAVSRKAVFETIDDCNSDGLKSIFCSYDDGERFKEYIKALPQVEPTISEIDKFNDSVNRATVLALINDVKNADGFKDYSHYEYLFDQVDEMPMATPTRRKMENESCSENPNKWIPMSEQYKNKQSNCNKMPLPKPYKETDSEQLLSYADQDTMKPAT